MEINTDQIAAEAAKKFRESGDCCRYDPILTTGKSLLETIIKSYIEKAACDEAGILHSVRAEYWKKRCKECESGHSRAATETTI